jgi:hypothetical protein
MVRGTTSLLEIIVVVVCESTGWDPLGDIHGCSIDDATNTSGSNSSIGYMEHTVSKLDTLAGVAIKYGVEVTNSLSCFFQSQISTL